LGSSNHTFVDGVRLVDDAPTLLGEGSALRLAADLPITVRRVA
ncbi:FHA domain-containing protein, partial [Bradyrhizobium sp. NBAIM08]|nr:FHA domain-containing protein [Bradyrhizobium sp. NBAIM08]